MRMWRSLAAIVLSLPLLLLLLGRPTAAAGDAALDLPAHISILKLSVSGKAPPGSRVESPQAAAAVTADKSGRFWMRLALKEGRNTVTLTAMTPDNRCLTWSGETSVDLLAPTLVADLPRSFNSEYYPLIGKASRGSTVTVEGKPVEVDSEGIFRTEVTIPEPGAVITVTATDASGRQTEARQFVARSGHPWWTPDGRAQVTFSAPPGSKTLRMYSKPYGQKYPDTHLEPQAGGTWQGWPPLELGWTYFWFLVDTPDGERYLDVVGIFRPFDVEVPIRTDLAEYELSGTVIPGWWLQINDTFVQADGQGRFSYKLPLAEGKQQLRIWVTSNQGRSWFKVSYPLTRIPPIETLYEPELKLPPGSPGTRFLYGGTTYLSSQDREVTIPLRLEPGENLVRISTVDANWERRVHVYRVTYRPSIKVRLTVDQETAYVDHALVPLAAAPRIRDGSTYLPLRFLGEVLGAKVEWEQSTRTVTYTRGARVIKITVGERRALVDGQEVQLTAPAVLENDRTLVPVRFISENLGAKVSWDEATRTVTVLMPKE